MVDASNHAVGAALHQRRGNVWKPLGFYSCKLSDRERKYSTYDRELLAIYLGVKNFKDWIEGRDLIVYTDQKPLTYAFKQEMNKATPRQQRQLNYISEYTTNLVHVSGADNHVADALSRIEAINMPSTIDYRDLASKQVEDPEITKWKEANPEVKEVFFPSLNLLLLCQHQEPGVRTCVPKEYRRVVFDKIYGLCHLGVRSTKLQLLQHFVWPGVNKNVA